MDQANLIKIAAVVTAIPRWVVALMASEGFVLPEGWKPWWIIFSAASAAGMAIVEGVSFAYVFNAWKKEPNATKAGRMIALAILSALIFVVLLTPSIAASVQGVTVGAVLTNFWVLLFWSATVAGSTISIVASVGYAQKQGARPKEEAAPKVDERKPEPEAKPVAITLPAPAKSRRSEIPADVPTPKSADELAAQMAAGVRWTKNSLANRGMSMSTARNWIDRARSNGVTVAAGQGKSLA